MLVYKVQISDAQQPVGHAKIAMSPQQFAAVTQPGGCELWPELRELFCSDRTDIRADAVWRSDTATWLHDLDAHTAESLYAVSAREMGFW